MRNIWRDPGAEVLVGLLSFAVSFIAIGLALIAVKLACYGYWAFVISALLFIVAGIAIISLFRHEAKTKRYIRQIGLYLQQGYTIRQEILMVEVEVQWTSELKGKEPQWESDVQQWLDHNLPDHAPDFSLDTITSTSSYFFYDEVFRGASSVALRLESRLGNLREILRDIRR